MIKNEGALPFTDLTFQVTVAPTGGGGGTPVPVGPLGILMLLAGILGSAFVGLPKKA